MSTFNLSEGQEVSASDLVSTGLYTKTADVTLSEKLLMRYEPAHAMWARQAKEDEDFRDGAQWSREAERRLKRRKQTPLTINVVKPAVENAKALLTANKPRFSSTSFEDSDVRTGKMFSELMSHIWRNSEGDVQHKVVIDDYYVKGLGYWQVYFDPQADFGKGDIFVASVDPYDVFVDPSSKDIFFRDAAHLLIVRTLTAEQLQRSFPLILKTIRQHAAKVTIDRKPISQRVGMEGQTDITGTTDPDADMYECIDRYSRLKIQYIHVVKVDDGTEAIYLPEEYKRFLAEQVIVEASQKGMRIITDPQELQSAMQRYKATGGVYHFAKDVSTGQPQVVPGEEQEGGIPGSTVQMTLTTNAQLVANGAYQTNEYYQDRILRVLSVGGVEISKSVMPISQYPLVPVVNHWRRTPYPMSDIRFVRSIQEYINRLRTLIIAHAANSANVKVLLPRGSVKKDEYEREFNKVGAGFVEFNAEVGQPVIAAPVPLPNEIYKNESDARKDIENILGIYEFMQGGTQNAPDTYRGTMAMDEMGQRRIKSKLADVEGALTQLGKVVIEFIQAYYTEHKVVRLLEPNHQAQPLEINVPIYDSLGDEVIGKINDVTVGKYDIIVISGSMLPSNRWARFDYYMQLFDRQLIDQVEVLKQTEVVDMEGVLNRFSQIQKLTQQLQGAEAEIKRLTGDLQTSQREGVQDRKRVEVEKFKANLKGVHADVKAQATVMQGRMQDELDKQSDLTSGLETEQDDASEPAY